MKSKVLLYSLPILLIFSMIAWGQEQKQAPMKKSEMKQMKKDKMDWTKKRTEELTKALSLTPEQQEKVKSIYADEEKQMNEAKEKYSGNKDEMKKAHRSVMEDTNKKIEAVLTADQVTKFNEMQKKWKKDEKGMKSMKKHDKKMMQKPDSSMSMPNME